MIDETPEEYEVAKPTWVCQSCGYVDKITPMPPDREKFYQNPKPRRCRRCKSDDSVPQGY